MNFFQLHHFSSSSPNFIFIGFSKFIGAPFLSILLLRHRSLTSRSLGRSNRTFTWRGREPEPFSPLSDKLRWRDSFDLFYIYLDLLFDRPKFTWEDIQIWGIYFLSTRKEFDMVHTVCSIQYGLEKPTFHTLAPIYEYFERGDQIHFPSVIFYYIYKRTFPEFLVSV